VAGRAVHDPADDLELALYDAMLGNDYLHYGYFDPAPDAGEEISLGDIKRAMDAYAGLLASRVARGQRVLDVGCGTGGLLGRLVERGANVTGLTPNIAHARHIEAKWPGVPLLRARLEDIDTAGFAPGFDVVITSESFQYVDIDAGMAKIGTIMAPGGKWLVSDYFRLSTDAANRSGHLLDAFQTGLERHEFAVEEQLDITDNVLPTLKYAHHLAANLALPAAKFGVERFMRRRPWLAALVGGWARRKLAGVRLDTLDPAVFARQKRYMLFTLVRN
jgi:SAM-dependent methyltransferase